MEIKEKTATARRTVAPLVKKSVATPATKSVPKSGVRKIPKKNDATLRLHAIELRLAALESVAGTTSDANAGANPLSRSKRNAKRANAQLPLPASPKKFWALEHIQQYSPKNGATMFAGHVNLPGGETYAWQMETSLDDALAADWAAGQSRIAALAHPVRLSILKALLIGERDTQSLQALPDMGTTGQLYHHLKELESAGWIRQPRRGEYIVLAERVVPLLAILGACEITASKRRT
jgi:DNA-binding transcriptional ArsR family regulator